MRKGSKHLPESIERMRLIKTGKKYSLETNAKRNKSISLARIGHVVSEETREKLRQANLGKKYTEDVNKKKGRSGRIWSYEMRKSLSEKKKGKKFGSDFRAMRRRIRLQQVFPKQDTGIEIKLQNGLSDVGIRFEKHKAIENICQTDIFIKPNICIFADGCYWHNCQQCRINKDTTEAQRKNAIRDILQMQALLCRGYVVLRFWEHEINYDINQVVDKVMQQIKICEVKQ